MSSAALCSTASTSIPNLGAQPSVPPQMSLCLTPPVQSDKDNDPDGMAGMAESSTAAVTSATTDRLPPPSRAPRPSSPKRRRRPPPLLIPTRPPTSLPTYFYPNSNSQPIELSSETAPSRGEACTLSRIHESDQSNNVDSIGIWTSDKGCAAASRKGRRRRINEDRVFSQPELGIYGVCDGHGADSLLGSGNRKALNSGHNSIPAHKVCELLPNMIGAQGYSFQEAFQKMDLQICCMYPQCSFIGTTVTVVKIERGQYIQVAHVGDSRAMIITKNNKCEYLTNDHLPTNKKESERIERLGGHVFRGRVNGVLAVSRAIGDRALKSVVPPSPDVLERKINGDDQLLVLASDGLWDMVSNVEVYKTLKSLPSIGDGSNSNVCIPKDLQHAAKVLVDQAVARGSQDDISVVLVVLRHS